MMASPDQHVWELLRISHGTEEVNELTWLDVLPITEAQGVDHDTLAAEHVVQAAGRVGLRCIRRRQSDRFALSESQRPDSIGIAEGDHSESSEHGYTRVSSMSLSSQVTNRGENVLLVDTKVT